MKVEIAIVLVSMIAPMCPAQTEQPITGKSATGNISWEIRPPADNRGLSTVWLWPDRQKDKATQLEGADIPGVQDIEFSADDAWIVIQGHLSSGSFFSFYQKQADGSYAENKSAEDFFEIFDLVEQVIFARTDKRQLPSGRCQHFFNQDQTHTHRI